MSSGNQLWKFVLLALVIVVALVLTFIVLVRQDERAPLGAEIVYDDFGFSVLSSRLEKSIGALRADGVYRVVSLRIANHAQRVDFKLDQGTPLLEDAHGHRWAPDKAATTALRATASGPPRPESIRAGDLNVAEFVYDVPADASQLLVRISWGGSMIDGLDKIVSGDRAIVLPEPR